MNDPEPKPDKAQKYWRSNLILVTVLLSVWAIAGFGLSIFLIKTANQFEIGSVGFGFWICLLYTSPSPRDLSTSRMPSSA